MATIFLRAAAPRGLTTESGVRGEGRAEFKFLLIGVAGFAASIVLRGSVHAMGGKGFL